MSHCCVSTNQSRSSKQITIQSTSSVCTVRHSQRRYFIRVCRGAFVMVKATALASTLRGRFTALKFDTAGICRLSNQRQGTLSSSPHFTVITVTVHSEVGVADPAIAAALSRIAVTTDRPAICAALWQIHLTHSFTGRRRSRGCGIDFTESKRLCGETDKLLSLIHGRRGLEMCIIGAKRLDSIQDGLIVSCPMFLRRIKRKCI
jgi:hypothetical protein